MTIDERLTEFIEYCQKDTDRQMAIDAHLEIIRLRAENARLTAGIARIADDYYSDGGDTAELALSEMREALSGLLEGGE